MIKDQHKGSNCFVFPESADAGAEMWAEVFPARQTSSASPQASCSRLILKSRWFVHSIGTDPLLLGFKLVWEPAPGEQAQRHSPA